MAKTFEEWWYSEDAEKSKWGGRATWEAGQKALKDEIRAIVREFDNGNSSKYAINNIHVFINNLRNLSADKEK